MTGFWDGSGIRWSWAGPYANNLHLAPDRQPHQHLITQFLQAGCSSRRTTNSVKALTALVSKQYTSKKPFTHRLLSGSTWLVIHHQKPFSVSLALLAAQSRLISSGHSSTLRSCLLPVPFPHIQCTEARPLRRTQWTQLGPAVR